MDKVGIGRQCSADPAHFTHSWIGTPSNARIVHLLAKIATDNGMDM